MIVLAAAATVIPFELASTSALEPAAPFILKDESELAFKVRPPLVVNVEPLVPEIVPAVVVPLTVTEPGTVPVPEIVGVSVALAPPTVIVLAVGLAALKSIVPELMVVVPL